MARIWTKEDIGCHADASLGHQHCREALAQRIEAIDDSTPKQWTDLAASLRGDMSDDASEEDIALEILDEHCDGVAFVFQDGDLMLVESEEC